MRAEELAYHMQYLSLNPQCLSTPAIHIVSVAVESMTSKTIRVQAGTAYASEEGNINDQASGTEEANDYAGADMEIVGESDADIGAYSDLSGDDVLKEDVQKSESTEDIWCIGCSETTDEATSNIADQQVAKLPPGGVSLPTERMVGYR